MPNGKVRKVWSKAGRQNNAVLPTTQQSGTQATPALGLFGTPGSGNGGRTNTPLEATVPDDEGDGTVRTELLRLLKLPADELSKRVDLSKFTSAQMLARVMLTQAVVLQNKDAMAEVLDRIEGRPTKAANNKASNAILSEQLDSSLDDLNKLTENLNG